MGRRVGPENLPIAAKFMTPVQRRRTAVASSRDQSVEGEASDVEPSRNRWRTALWKKAGGFDFVARRIAGCELEQTTR
jgi:hypothetical protein